MNIKNKSGEIIKRVLGTNLRGADLGGADLIGADLGGADLGGADLRWADLGGAKGILHIQFEGYDLWVQKDKTKIGCKTFTNEKWLSVTKSEVKKNTNQLEADIWWKYKKCIELGIELLQ